MRSCFLAAADHLFETQSAKGLWQQSHGWFVPNLSPSEEGPHSTERLTEFRLAGTFFALFLLIMQHPVKKLSPHILLLLLCDACPPDYKYILAVDPESASVLAPFFDFVAEQGTPGFDRVVGTFRAGDVPHLLAEYLGDQVRLGSEIVFPTDAYSIYLRQITTYHNNPVMCQQGMVALWNTYLFGRRSFKNHPEWEAFLSGFTLKNLPLNVGNLCNVKCCTHFSSVCPSNVLKRPS
jgi:hypothetical protein